MREIIHSERGKQTERSEKLWGRNLLGGFSLCIQLNINMCVKIEIYLYLSPSVCPSNYLPKTVPPAPPSWQQGAIPACFSWEEMILRIDSQEAPLNLSFGSFFQLPCVLDAGAGLRECCLEMQTSIPAPLSAFTVAKALNSPF